MDELTSLQMLGLSEYESRAYLALAKLGPSTVKEIVEESRLPRSKTYEALQKLEQKNKVLVLPFTPRKYKVTNAELFREDVSDLKTSVESVINLVNAPKEAIDSNFFWILKGRQAVLDKFAEENARCQKEIFSFSDMNSIIPRNMKILEKACRRGVDVRFITPFDRRNIEIYKAWLALGTKMRVFDEKKFGASFTRLATMDRERGRITIANPHVKGDEYYMTFWVESGQFANMIRSYFLNVWKECRPIEEYF